MMYCQQKRLTTFVVSRDTHMCFVDAIAISTVKAPITWRRYCQIALWPLVAMKYAITSPQRIIAPTATSSVYAWIVLLFRAAIPTAGVLLSLHVCENAFSLICMRSVMGLLYIRMISVCVTLIHL